MSFQLEPERPAPPPKSSLLPRGCWIALIVFGVLTVVTVLVIVVGVYAISQNPEVRRVARVVSGSMRIVQQAQNAPGARAVRSLGCDQAMVIDAAQLVELAQELDDQVPEPQDDTDGRVIMCQLVIDRPPPTCQAVAQTYVAAVRNNQREFTVMVQTATHRGECSARYDPTGRLLQTLRGAPPTPAPVPAAPTPTPSTVQLRPSPFVLEQ